MSETAEVKVAKASAVITAYGDNARVSAETENPERVRVRLDFGSVAVFFSPADAHLLGAQMIAAAARLRA